MINNLYQINYNFYKFASKEGFLKKLTEFNAGQDIIDYVDSLEEKYCGIVVGAVAKNRNITLPEIQALVDKKRSVDQLKEQTSQEIDSELPLSLDEKFKEWAIIQSKKSGNRALLLSNLDKITLFFNENKEQLAQANFQLSSYDLPTLLSYINEIEESKKSLKENLSKISPIDQSFIQEFLSKTKDDSEIELLKINNPKLVDWARSKFLIIIENYKQKIIEACATQNKPFSHFKNEEKKIKDDINAGKYRGKEIPDTPLRNPEYENLMSHLEFLDDWQKNTNIELGNMSVRQAVNLSNTWHNQMAQSGIGLQYNPIDRSKIVYGPNNWEDEENNGFFILELTNENDLKVEGAKLNHCVGGYGEKIENKQSRIFSLRNINDVYKPILTIETDMSGSIVRQDYGFGDRRIDQKYHDMVTEWSSKNLISVENILKLSISDRLMLAERTDNENFLLKLSEDPEISVRLVLVERTDNEKLLEKFSNDTSDRVRAALARKTTNESLLLKLSKDPNLSVIKEVADNKNISQEALENVFNKIKLLDDNLTRSIRARVAEASTNPDLLAILANDTNIYVKRILLNNKNINQKVLAILAKDSNLEIRETVASNENTSQDSLAQLFMDAISLNNDSGKKILIQVAKNKNTSQEVLSQLARNENENIRWEVASNINTSEEILEKLTNDKSFEVQNRAASNNNLTNQNLLEMLAYKGKAKSGVARNNNTSEQTLAILILDKSDRNDYVREVVAEKTTSQELLAILVEDMSDSVRRSAARNKNISQELLEKLAKDRSTYVILEVINNNNTSEDLLEILSKKDNLEIRAAIAKKTTNQKLLSKLIKDKSIYNVYVRADAASNNNISQDLLAILATDNHVDVLVQVAKNKNTSQQILAKLIDYKNIYLDKSVIRAAVASNPNISRDLLEILAKDTALFVKNIAIERLKSLASSNKINQILKKATLYYKLTNNYFN